MRKALVTGGCGFIGSHLVDRLIKENFHITIIDNCSTGRLINLDHIAERSRLDIITKDLKQKLSM
jgi:UDP-glucose 4-epimerase